VMSENSVWPLGEPRQLRSQQRTEVWVADIGGSAQPVYSSATTLFEAPNWAPDGQGLLLNGNGLLWRLDLDPLALNQVTIPGLPPINNDYVVDATSGVIYLSANDGHIYVAPIDGGAPERVTDGGGQGTINVNSWSPDSRRFAFVAYPIEQP